MLALLKRMNRRDITVHGFRSSFRDWAAEQTNFPREVAEAALAHAIQSRVEAAYRRSDLFDKRRLLMEKWARYCQQEQTEGNGKVLDEADRQGQEEITQRPDLSAQYLFAGAIIFAHILDIGSQVRSKF